MLRQVALLALVLSALTAGCRSHGGQGASPATSEAAPVCRAPESLPPHAGPSCEEPAPGALEPATGSTSILGGPLAPCSAALSTGWFRDGSCNTDADDRGVHVVCAEVTDEFLRFSRSRGNDLVSPQPAMRFPGLRAGDRWCLCAERWREAHEAGVAPPVLPAATHAKALRYVTREALLERTR